MKKSYTESEVKNCLKENYEAIFNKYKKLTLLYALKTRANKYIIEGEIDDDSFRKDIGNTIEFNQISFNVKKGTPFNPINSNSLSYSIAPGDRIRNSQTKHKNGSVGFVFTLQNTDNFYLVTNKHVIGRKYPKGDTIQKVIFVNEHTTNFKNIGNYHCGLIGDYLDIAIVALNNNFSYHEKESLKINTVIDDFENITINNVSQRIVSKYAYAKIVDNDLYKTPKILKEQILTNSKMSKGTSGSLAINNKLEATGLLFAKNSNFSILNNINHVIDYISKELDTKKEYIKISNQFKL